MRGGHNRLTVPDGYRFGTRVVLKSRMVKGFQRSPSGRLQRSLVQCDCGHKVWITTSEIKKRPTCSVCCRRARRLNLIGAIFGSRTVLASKMVTLKNGGTQQRFLAKCILGHKSWTTHAVLQKAPACYLCRGVRLRTLATIGQSFGRRKVLALKIRNDKKGSTQMALMQCRCGSKPTWAVASCLLKGRLQMCGVCSTTIHLNLYHNPNLTKKELEEILVINANIKGLRG